MKKQNKTSSKKSSPKKDTIEIQEQSKVSREQIPRKHPHGETGKSNEQVPRKHPHDHTTPVDNKKVSKILKK